MEGQMGSTTKPPNIHYGSAADIDISLTWRNHLEHLQNLQTMLEKRLTEVKRGQEILKENPRLIELLEILKNVL